MNKKSKKQLFNKKNKTLKKKVNNSCDKFCKNYYSPEIEKQFKKMSTGKLLPPTKEQLDLRIADCKQNFCNEGCKPQRSERRHNDHDPKKRTYFAKYDLAKIAEIGKKQIPHWFPPHRMMNVKSDTEPWGDEWRPGRNFRTVIDLFTKRNAWALALVLENCDSNDDLRLIVQSAIMASSRRAQHLDEGGGYI